MGTTRTIWRGCLALWLLAAGFVATAPPAHASWAGDNCRGQSWEMNTWKRSQALAYAERARKEGYEWGGGCYRLNDVDDTPGLPDSGGEGADCSGFVFKTWALKQDGSNSFRFWEHEKEVHGPYSTFEYYNAAADDPFKTIAKGYQSTLYMDAFVYRVTGGGHIAMIDDEGSGGFDYVIHARGDDWGTRIDYLDYRQWSNTKGVTRRGWTPECYPNCL
jgi:hypothetical protein